MHKVLHDPNQPPHALIEEREDGSALRNDGVELKPANRNPWYVLATIYGEQGKDRLEMLLGGYDEKLAARNRRAWNGWVCRSFPERKRSEFAKRVGLNPKELSPLSEEERADIEQRFSDRMEALGIETTSLPEVPFEENLIEFDPPWEHDFSNLIFKRPVCFARFVFPFSARFEKSRFLADVRYWEAAFVEEARFGAASFCGEAVFIHSEFRSLTDFSNAVFENKALFHNAKIYGYSWFDSVKFGSTASFDAAKFEGAACFGGEEFGGRSIFDGASFMETASFRSTTFSGGVSFDSAKFSDQTIFTDARFLTHVPTFHAAELYDDTVFPIPENYRKNWPPQKGSVKITGQEQPVKVMEAGDQKRAYARLRRFMADLHMIDEEQFFHRMEMRCKKAMANWKHRPLYRLYSLLSDYGISVWRPLAGLSLVFLVGMLAMLWWDGAFTFLPKETTGFDWAFGLGGSHDPWAEPRKAAGWSISNTLPFLGLVRLYYADTAKDLAWQLKLIGGLQSLVGIFLLFLLGLGLRNRFRLR